MVPTTDSDSVTKPDIENVSAMQKFGAGIICLCSFLLLYFLMAGPLVWLEGKMKFRPFTKSVQTVYAPLVLVSKSDVEPAAKMVKAYVQLFK